MSRRKRRSVKQRNGILEEDDQNSTSSPYISDPDQQVDRLDDDHQVEKKSTPTLRVTTTTTTTATISTSSDESDQYDESVDSNGNRNTDGLRKRRSSFSIISQKVTEFALHQYHQVPHYLKSRYILSSYRVNFSFKLAFQSLFRMHNETLNVWTHIIGFILFCILMFRALNSWLLPPEADGWDRIFFLAFIIAAQAQMMCSFVFHWFCCMSQAAYQHLARLDYTGITFLIVGSKMPVLHYLLHCYPSEQAFWMVSVSVIGLACLVVSLLPFFQTPKYQTLRALLFIGLGLVGGFIFPHAMYLCGPTILPIVGELMLMGALYIGGATIYATNIPERWWPGKFDIYGHSHTIWHVFVIAACYVHYTAVHSSFQWKLSHTCEAL